MVKAQVFINIGSGNFTCRNRPDHGSGAGDTVATGKYAIHVRHLCVRRGLQSSAALDFNAALFEPVGFDSLPDRHDNGICRDSRGSLRRSGWTRAALLVHFTGDLRLCPKSGYVSLRICLNSQGGLQG